MNRTDPAFCGMLRDIRDPRFGDLIGNLTVIPVLDISPG